MLLSFLALAAVCGCGVCGIQECSFCLQHTTSGHLCTDPRYSYDVLVNHFSLSSMA